ncbi:hypothetical protein SESBI_34929 [Sesbania bispinosa]|nr:hypothetical protein SESBI_34929 [Sesbania bispinosa]
MNVKGIMDGNGAVITNWVVKEDINDDDVRGLSMFYQGKTQSFSSLARVQSIEDLPKKDRPYRKRMKSCKSYGGGLDSHRISYTPKATISKKASRGPFVSLLTKRGGFLGGSRPSFAVQRNF